MDPREDVEVSNKIIDALGGTCATSRIAGLTSQAVTVWRRKGMPRPWALWLRLKYKKQLKAAGIVE